MKAGDGHCLPGLEYNSNRWVSITGGKPLIGNVHIPGDKISAVHCLLAALICEKPTEIRNLPLCGDVAEVLDWAAQIGQAEVVFLQPTTVVIKPTSAPVLDLSRLRHLRAPICLATALALRNDYLTFSIPGGCDFTTRPIDRHLALMRSAGLTVERTGDKFEIYRRKIPAPYLAFNCAAEFVPSVGVTCNALITSLSFPGEIALVGCAIEPVVRTLTELIAQHTKRSIVADDRSIHILPLTSPDSGEITSAKVAIELPPDATVLATYLAALAACGGRLNVSGADTSLPFLDRVLDSWGIKAIKNGHSISYESSDVSHFGDISCEVWPGIPTDIGPLLIASVAAIPGTSHLRDAVFPCRSSHVKGLCGMGYQIEAKHSEVIVTGARPHSRLVQIRAPDIRAGAALVVGALARNGITEIRNVRQIARGYCNLLDNLRRLGADLTLNED